MTREQQRKLRGLNQHLSKLLKGIVKPYGLKKKDYMVWGKKEDMYFSLLVDIREKDGRCYCSSHERIKPLWMDDLFWDIMDMPGNKKEPLSLRCIGAFAIYGMTCYECRKELPEWSVDALEQCVEAYVGHFHDTVSSGTMEDYYSVFDCEEYQGDIQELLVLIHNQEYQKAQERIESLEGNGQFQNKGIWFKEYAERYCRDNKRRFSSLQAKSLMS